MRIAARFFECFGEVAAHVANERVKTIRTVQCDRDDGVGFGDLYLFIFHSLSEWC